MRIALCVMIHVMALSICSQSLFAWTGETWGPISREEILRRASEMINFSWSPLKNISNQCSLSEPRHLYTAGTVHRGIAYNRYNDPVDNWADFYPKVNSVSCQTPPCLTSYGNECSSFVSIAWRLPTRYNTTTFENDAKSDGGYVTKLGEFGSGQNISRSLLPGDAFVNAGIHILLFDRLHYTAGDNDGIVALEQTPPYAIRESFWRWKSLASYRPIRRNNIDEGNYAFVTKWGEVGAGYGQFNYSVGVAVDSLGSVYITDYDNDRVQKFNNNGGFMTTWGSRGAGNGQMRSPHGIACDSSGNVYVTDEGNSRVQKFASSGSYITQWGALGSGNGQFETPRVIATDSSGSVYVGDTWLDRIQKFTSAGSYQTQWGSPWPGGIAVDIFNNVFVSDIYNHRIQKFNSSGVLLRSWGNCCAGDGNFSGPEGVAVDSSGNVYVADSGNQRIQVFDGGGNFLTKWGTGGNNDGQFMFPKGVAVDSALNVFVADTGHHRIQKFRPVTPYPTRPTGLTATALSSTQIQLRWTDNSSNESGFNIVRRNGIREKWEVIQTDLAAGSTSFVDTVPGSGTYFYSVYAVNGSLYSAYSNEAYATVKTYGANILDVPTGTNVYSYAAVSSPVLDPNPALAKPVAVMNSATPNAAGTSVVTAASVISGGYLNVQVAFPPFTAPVDIYLAVNDPTIAPNFFIIDPGNIIGPVKWPFPGTNAKWRENVIGPIDEIVIKDMPVAGLAPATYTLYAIVFPAGSTASYYQWETSFTVQASAQTHLISVSALPAQGNITPSGIGGTVAVYQGATQTFTVNPNSGYQIASVTVDSQPVSLVNNQYTFYNVTSNHTLNVTFAPIPYPLSVTKTGSSGGGTVVSSPAGINCGATCSATFNNGASITLTATADSQSSFTGWSGGVCFGTGLCEFVMSGSTTINAAFTSYTLAVGKTGGGTVTSTDGSINCGLTCQQRFRPGSLVTLSATPDVNTIFTGWSGGCSGSGVCAVTMNGDTAVTADFIVRPAPVADFTGVPLTGAAPLAVTFTDLSANAPTSWLWDFGDGTTSTLQNPTHPYRGVGTYTVTLTAANAGGSNSMVKTNYIATQSCSSMPVRINRAPPIYYSSLGAAYTDAVTGDVIQIQAARLIETLTLGSAKDVIIEGGYDCGFSGYAGGETLIQGQLRTSVGATRLRNIRMEK